MNNEIVTAIGTPNIALIKYWGKRNKDLILPTNSSISITLDETLNTKTSVVFSDQLKEDGFYLNGKLMDLSDPDTKERFSMVQRLKEMAKTSTNCVVVSVNSFPTAAGMASSASGVSTLTYAASHALGLNLSKREMSIVARMGSGSACRSIYGGFVEWRAGKKEDGSDSYAKQVAKKKDWPEIIDMIAIASEKKKKVLTRAGMAQTIATSTLYGARVKNVKRRMTDIKTAIKNKDFETMAKITMIDSNNMHATMLDTWPPLFYMNDISRDIVYKIHELNEAQGHLVAAYTFDAGPNASIITLAQYESLVRSALKEVEGLKDVLKSGIGDGPRLLSNKESLIDEASLQPKQNDQI